LSEIAARIDGKKERRSLSNWERVSNEYLKVSPRQGVAFYTWALCDLSLETLGLKSDEVFWNHADNVVTL